MQIIHHVFGLPSNFWRWFFWILVMLTLWLSLIPADQVPSGLHFWDKAQHAFGFLALGLLGLMAYTSRVLAILIGLALFGAGIEVAQWLTGWRNGDWQDWLADCVGFLMGYMGWRLMNRIRCRTK